ncbi:MAG TPA: hypothetical protein VLK89_03610 [Solirubrobacterales bacterium]|nr:hypothetical protein [Solirubrobacterales bacterium]
MRRHAKASAAGSTQRQANGLGRFFRGAFATRSSSLGDRGGSAPLIGTLVLVGLAGVVALLAVAQTPAAAAECPNEIRRQEQGVSALALPDCRAYENASPGSQPHVTGGSGFAEAARASASGNQVLYRSKYPAIGAEHSGQLYVSTRGPGGWSPKNVIPQETPDTGGVFSCTASVFFSPDFSKNVLEEDYHVYPGVEGNSEGNCEHNQEILDPREKHGYRNLFIHDAASDGYELVSLNNEDGTPGNSYFVGASTDFSKIAFRSEAQLTPDAPSFAPNFDGGYNLFISSGEVVRLVTYLPNGTPVAGEELGVYAPAGGMYEHFMSSDGSRIFFRHGGDLYVRLNPDQPPSATSGGACTEPAKACTLQVDESQGPGASGGGNFEFASPDGSKAFFTSDHKLTPDSTAVANREDLYEFDVDTGDLTDLTVNAGEPAGVWAVSGFSEDGSYVYFVAEGALAPGALPGDCEHYVQGNTCNLYLLHEGTIHFVAALSVDDVGTFQAGAPFFSRFNYNGTTLLRHRTDGASAQASPNGRFFGFTSYQSITGYDNTDPDSGHPITEIFLYDAATDQLNCISCPPTTAPPAEATLFSAVSNAGRSAPARKNQVLDNGQAFFTTSGALAAADINEAVDVYEWENGGAHLISGGTEPSASDFLDATADGSDAFFVTAGALVSSDRDGATSLYDAHVGGGFPEPPPLPGCEGEACRGAGTSAPSSSGAGTAAFQGPGNQAKGHKADCGLTARRAQKLSREARSLSRRANQAGSEQGAKRLRRQAAQLAKQGEQISRNAKRCRRSNRGAGK